MASQHDSAEPITTETHDNSWSANLEKPVHADDPDLVLRQAGTAIDQTTAGNHVNLVTHGDLGHPRSYLHDEVRDRPDVADLEYVEQCGCGGHVTRVYVEGRS